MDSRLRGNDRGIAGGDEILILDSCFRRNPDRSGSGDGMVNVAGIPMERARGWKTERGGEFGARVTGAVQTLQRESLVYSGKAGYFTRRGGGKLLFSYTFEPAGKS